MTLTIAPDRAQTEAKLVGVITICRENTGGPLTLASLLPTLTLYRQRRTRSHITDDPVNFCAIEHAF
ncbi:hypothetical protein AB8Z38_15580 [Bradyrhizobium sp. LLZ17]|uniref:Uncharacterized protein n=1 Tax=Bradyrhizobium sp. LLZ17 TaxID=3239388 RepID=A0AB39XTP3_9BRAD